MPGWLSQLSIRLQVRSWSHSLWVWAPHQALCGQLTAWACFGFCVSLSLSLPLPCSVLSLSKINIKKIFFNVLVRTQEIESHITEMGMRFQKCCQTLDCIQSSKCWTLNIFNLFESGTKICLKVLSHSCVVAEGSRPRLAPVWTSETYSTSLCLDHLKTKGIRGT